ncbi:MAG TPA: hypothetical protein VH062_25685 [Polyangiaceae bacterium]|jgi:polyhydroxybutyrate depolymerase|nr:hypothetical protein [Polyangiaceae bacterium]
MTTYAGGTSSTGSGGTLVQGSGGQTGGGASGGTPSSGGGTMNASGGSGGATSGGSTNGGAANGGASGAAGAAGAGGGASACTGKPGARRGKSSQMVSAGGAMRTFVYYAPQNLDANKPVPIVIIPHGFTMSGDQMFTITGYDKIADREGFIAIYPDGEPGSLGPWNVGTGVCGLGAFVGGTGDDQSFVDAMISFTEADQCVDHDHVFMSGFSMGGYFSNETGCLRKEIRAIAPHSGGTHPLSTCKVGHKPVILFHFTTDALISYSCGQGARDEWATHNGCNTASPMTTMVKGGSCEYYSCPADGQVALCSFITPSNHANDGFPGHAWSGGAAGQAFSISETESASELGWAFFKKYAW